MELIIVLSECPAKLCPRRQAVLKSHRWLFASLDCVQAWLSSDHRTGFHVLKAPRGMAEFLAEKLFLVV
jgi:hypothetical protein